MSGRYGNKAGVDRKELASWTAGFRTGKEFLEISNCIRTLEPKYGPANNYLGQIFSTPHLLRIKAFLFSSAFK